MKVGDLVIYKPYVSTYEGTGLIHTKELVTRFHGGRAVRAYRYKINWLGKPPHVGKKVTWNSAQDVEVISEGR